MFISSMRQVEDRNGGEDNSSYAGCKREFTLWRILRILSFGEFWSFGLCSGFELWILSNQDKS